jgi:hypothetical protein
MDGTTDVNLNTSKTLIFYANIEWLGVGGVTLGVIINNTYYDVHKFRHSNILTIPYITSASLPLRWEIISTGGVGSMKAICGTVISEGGFNPIGSIFSANMGSSTKAVNNENPLIALRVKSSNSKTLIILKNYTVMSSSGANVIVRVWKFRDVTAASVLTGSSFNSVNTNSVAEYDVSSSAISTTGGQLMFNTYFSNNNDQIPLINSQDTDMSFNNGLSELIVITAETIGGNENLIAGLTWKEIV